MRNEILDKTTAAIQSIPAQIPHSEAGVLYPLTKEQKVILYGYTGLTFGLTEVEQRLAVMTILGVPVSAEDLNEPWLRAELVQKTSRDYASMIRERK